MNLGLHLMVDMFECSENTDNSLVIYELLEELPSFLGMKKLMPPFLFRYQPSDMIERGWTGFIVIAESHVSVHTWPEKHMVAADLFSCKPFDAQIALTRMERCFRPGKTIPRKVSRGLYATE